MRLPTPPASRMADTSPLPAVKCACCAVHCMWMCMLNRQGVVWCARKECVGSYTPPIWNIPAIARIVQQQCIVHGVYDGYAIQRQHNCGVLTWSGMDHGAPSVCDMYTSKTDVQSCLIHIADRYNVQWCALLRYWGVICRTTLGCPIVDRQIRLYAASSWRANSAQ